MTKESRDRIFATAMERVAAFQFDERTAHVFDDMIVRSVPGYRMTVAMTGLISNQFAQPASRLFDLGCSLGACTLAMAANVADTTCRIIGVDNSIAMLDRCRDLLDETDVAHIELRHDDIRSTDISTASVVVLNFTLQFLPIEERRPLLQRIHDGLLPGGVLILSEKIVFDDPQVDRLLFELHHAFKRANGYADLEISQKRDSLEDVLIREPSSIHKRRLEEIGFSCVTPWLQCFNFASFLAVK